MKVILSIKPEYANKIFNGSKKFEFRRSLFKNENVNKVVVYASAPISRIIGEFEIANVIDSEIKALWVKTKKYSGISEDYFMKYFHGKETGFAIEVKKAKRYKKDKCIKETFGMSPPQSFAYIRK